MNADHLLVSARRVCLTLSAGALFGLGILPGSARGAEVSDWRHGALKDLNGDFSFTPPVSRELWAERSAALRQQVQVAMGLLPWPEKTPLKAVIHGRREAGDFTIEKVYFEALPGFYVTGSLYRPVGLTGKLPAVLSPHGHWPDGRFMRAADAEVQRQLASGGEKDEAAARSPLQARCVNLARMGCVVFHYDMIGYADSIQLPATLAHTYKVRRPAMEGPERWGFFSAQAEGRLQSIMGLQTWSSIRALDFLTSLPEVDPARIGVTGASGGATQTFILTALDPRPAVMFPAVMVSTGMQGGCTCENASLLRIGTGNVELAALFAPKPASFTAADDWTKEFQTKGFPELQAMYRLTGAPDQVSLLSRTEFPHNYNLHSRLAMYGWMAAHLKTPRPAPAVEPPMEVLAKADLTVWDATHPAPAAGDPEFEKSLLKTWQDASASALAADPASAATGWQVLAGRTWTETAKGPFDWKPDASRSREGAVQRIPGVLSHGPKAEQTACTFLYPDNWSGKLWIMLTKAGAPAAGDAAGADPAVKAALEAGTAVAFPTLFTDSASASGQVRRVAGDRDFLGYTDGYNTPPLARRAQDLMAILAWVRQHEPKAREVRLSVAADAAPEALLALSQVPAGSLNQVEMEPVPFRFASLTDAFDARLLPGAVKYGDIPALIELAKSRHTLTIVAKP
ncbi:MAG: hypothetical protein JWL81_602 [Verrucomicrobiales bacterium]|nr:hypothetical protein [Verrucomicrobiales bacterium]